MRLFQRQLPGFTLIELIITVAITALVVGGSIAGFVSFTDRQEVLNSAQRVQQMMRNAQSKARVREKPNDANCVTLDRYRVYFNGSNTFNLRPGCLNASDTLINSAVIATILLPTDVTVSPAPARWIDFHTLEEGTTGGTTFVFSGGGYDFQFTVSSTGSISNVEPY